jgi:hypothetical protein
MMLRIVAGESPCELSLDSVRDPTGSPVLMKR